uniref:Uncharacterized protein n=1 Tax=Rhizophora mucronata TaxID=61149 RepID=A0A2P2MA07_RHIMU
MVSRSHTPTFNLKLFYCLTRFNVSCLGTCKSFNTGAD